VTTNTSAIKLILCLGEVGTLRMQLPAAAKLELHLGDVGC
jgi:hypothetical protein